MQQKNIVLALVGAGLISTLAGCGGGPAGSSINLTPPGTGTVNMAITDGPSDTFDHVWVTVTGIAFHTDPDAVWSPGDATWQKTMLSAPVTIDLAALNNGLMNDSIFAGMPLTPGSYKQVRFFFASDTDPLSGSAQAIHDNEAMPKALQWNDQVEYVNSSNQVSEAPLEIADLRQGMQLTGSFNVTAGETLNLATDFDLEKIITPYVQNGLQAFTIKPDLLYFNLSNSGGISGNVDTAHLCHSIPVFNQNGNCAFNLIVHAEALNAITNTYEDVRSTSVGANGKFTLAPLSMTDSAGNPIKYDIVIRGRQMQTVLVTGVTPGGTYTGSALSGAALLQPDTSPVPVVAAYEYGAQLTNPLAPLTSGHVKFQQTPTGGVAHLIRWADTDPFTGLLSFSDRAHLAPWAQYFWLANSGLNAATYANGAALTYGVVTNTEGAGGYSVAANEVVYYGYGANQLLSAPAANVFTNTVAVNAPTLDSNVVSGTVSGTINVAANDKYTSGQLIIARFGHIITVQNIPSANFAPAGGAYDYSVTGLGAGTASSEVGGAYYYAYLRLFDGNGKRVIVPVTGSIDLRSTNSVTGLNVSI